jgi:hypothetical protein
VLDRIHCSCRIHCSFGRFIDEFSRYSSVENFTVYIFNQIDFDHFYRISPNSANLLLSNFTSQFFNIHRFFKHWVGVGWGWALLPCKASPLAAETKAAPRPRLHSDLPQEPRRFAQVGVLASVPGSLHPAPLSWLPSLGERRADGTARWQQVPPRAQARERLLWGDLPRFVPWLGLKAVFWCESYRLSCGSDGLSSCYRYDCGDQRGGCH